MMSEVNNEELYILPGLFIGSYRGRVGCFEQIHSGSFGNGVKGT